MKITTSFEHLRSQLFIQLKNMFLLESDECSILDVSLLNAIARTEYCFSFNNSKYYKVEGEVIFNPLHTSQYGIFLYFLANTIFKNNGAIYLCEKIYGLSKMINAFDLYYQVSMPNIFFMDHPVGSVLGRAKYDDYFSFCQNVTVGNNKGIYPTIGKHVTMLPGSTCIGETNIGDNVLISAGTYIKDQNVPNCSLVFGRSPDLIIKSKPIDFFMEINQ